MRKLLLTLIAGVVLFSAAGVPGTAQIVDMKPAKEQIKARQKEERRVLKLKERYTKQSLKGQSLPKTERVRVKHDMKRERRDLRLRQKDERQALRDRERSMKESQNRI